MARAFQNLSPSEDFADQSEWSSLRGELVALLDQVEGRYQTDSRGGAEADGFARRVRDLRSQVGETRFADSHDDERHRAALRSVKRAVDRFSERDEHAGENDDLRAAIAEIRGRQGAQPSALAPLAFGSRAAGRQPLNELSSLVSQLSGRLTGLEGELRAQRSNAGQVREVATQVEQLSHVVELLAGAVGETGQVKRLETQMAGLARLIETNSHPPDLSAVNARLDELAATVSRLAELQVQQMEREIVRDQQPAPESALAPAMQAIEEGMRSVYDRIDAIERAHGSSNGEFSRFNAELGRIARMIESRDAEPHELAGLIENLVERIDRMEARGPDAGALRVDLENLGRDVVRSMTPRFEAIESQLGALGDPSARDELSRLAGSVEDRLEKLDADMVRARDLSALISAIDERMAAMNARDDISDITAAIEERLSGLHERLDTTSAQLDGLRRLASEPVQTAMRAEDIAHITSELGQRTEAGLDMLTRRTEDSIARLAGRAGLGPDAGMLAALDDKLWSLISSDGRGQNGPDLEALAERVAQRTSEVLGRPVGAARPMDDAGLEAFENRVADLIRTNGRDTTERLERLEMALTGRSEEAPRRAAGLEGLDAVLTQLAGAQAGGRASEDDPARDLMPAEPVSDDPLIDRGPAADIPLSPPPAARAPRPEPEAMPVARAEAERPPKPVSSFDSEGFDPFSEPPAPPAEAPAAPPRANAQSTFIAAARRAQLTRQAETPPAAGNSLIGRALARVMPARPDEDDAPAAPVAEPEAPVEKPAGRWSRRRKPEPAPAAEPADIALPEPEDAEQRAGFLARNKRAVLLGVALLAVSALALNLALQRVGADQPPAPAATIEPAAAPAGEIGAVDPLHPAPNAGIDSAFVAPRIPDTIDATPTASIARDMRAVGANAATPTALAMPAALTGAPRAPDTEAAVAPAVLEEIENPVTFELPPEGAGPEPLRQAAADGDPRAQFEVAAILTEGQAIEQDLAAAATWYERAAGQGFVPAQYRLGNFYESGSGVERDLEMARLWYQRAAEAGHRMAMHNLAAIHASGELGEQDFTTAAEWFERAAGHGMTDSQFNLGMLYARGLGVEQDFEASYRWFAIAALRGDQDAGPARDDVARSLSAEAVQRLDAEIAEWRPAQVDLTANFAPIGTWSDAFDPGEPIANAEVVTRVQQVLTRLGYDVGTADGMAGPKTGEAIRAFERGTGMSETGRVNPRLLAVLGSQPV